MQLGDVIEFDYEMYVEGQEGLFDTTKQERAQEAGIAKEGAYYAPMRYLVGAGRLIPGLEDAIRDAKVGDPFEVTIAPNKAYGERDPDRIETVPIHEFKKAKIDPEVGLSITWKGRQGIVRSVGGGRVRVDFNPALAGKTLRYKVEVLRVYSEPAERIVGLFLMNYPSPEPPNVEIKKKEAIVEVPESAKFDPNWLRAKMGFLSSVLRNSEVASVRFVESHDLPREEAAQKEATPVGA